MYGSGMRGDRGEGVGRGRPLHSTVSLQRSCKEDVLRVLCRINECPRVTARATPSVGSVEWSVCCVLLQSVV